jgi:threonine dehydratase
MSVSALPDSRAAQELVARHARRTPLLTSRLLSEETGFDARLKAELFQRTGSYKIRGPLVKLERLSEEERARGVVCSSAGNHAQGVALAARLLGVRAVVVIAENATPSKVEATRGYGAEVVLHGTIWDEADAKARELVESDGLTYVHPFDDVDLISGQGTVGIEILEDWPEVELIVVPIGGGGLISGIAAAVKRGRPDVRVIGVESADGPAMQTSVARGELVTLDRVDTIIDGLRVKRVGETTFELVRRFVDEIVAVPDEEIFENVLWTMARAKLVAEGAGAVAVAALMRGGLASRRGTTVAIVSGGNIDSGLLAALLQRQETELGRRVRIFTHVTDRPGGLAKLLGLVAAGRANIVSVEHVREAVHLPVRETGVALTLETRGPDHTAQLVAALRDHGYEIADA